MSERQTADVVLGADVSGYVSEVNRAQTETNALAGSLDTLANKLNGITKRTGQKMELFAAGSLATMTAMTLRAGQYDKQLSTLRATTKVTGGDINQFSKVIKDAAAAFPASRSEVAALVTEITSLGITSATQADSLTRTFLRLGASTGESIPQLTQQMIMLGRAMGTLQSGGMENYADSLVRVSKSAGVSATQVASFSNSIAPFARTAGIGETAVLGLSAAFSRAGADGFAAANTFNSMLADITRNIQNGSPDIAKYSNLIGVTVQQFKQMDPAERLIQIFEAIGTAGPDAIQILDRMGYDGLRAAKAIQQVSQQSGGLRKSVAEATASFGDGTNAEASAAALDNLQDTLGETAEAFDQLAIAIGTKFTGALQAALQPLNALIGGLGTLMEGPMGTGAAWTAAAGAAVVGGAGALLSGWKTAGSVAMATTVARGGPAVTGVNSFRAGRAMAAARAQAAAAGTPFGGAERAAVMRSLGAGGNTTMGRYMDPKSGGLGWWNTPFMYAGMGMGEVYGDAFKGNTAGKFLSAPFRMSKFVAEGTRDFYRNSSVLDPYDRRSQFLRPAGEAVSRQAGVLSSAAMHPIAFGRGFFGADTSDLKDATTAASKGLADAGKQAKAASMAMLATARANVVGEKAQVSLAASAGAAARALAVLPVSAAKNAISSTAQLAGAGLMRAGAGLGSLLGGPPMIALMGGMGAFYANSAITSKKREEEEEGGKSSQMFEYAAAVGAATDNLDTFSRMLTRATDALPKAKNWDDVSQVSSEVGNLGRTPNRDLTNPFIGQLDKAGMSNETVAAYMATYSNMTPEQLQQAQADLVQEFGAERAQQITDLYMNQRGNPDLSALFSGVAQSTDNLLLPGLNPGAESGDLYSAGFQYIADQTYKVGNKYGDEAANQYQVTNQLDYMAKAISAAEGDADSKRLLVRQFEDTMLGGTRTGFDGLVNSQTYDEAYQQLVDTFLSSPDAAAYFEGAGVNLTDPQAMQDLLNELMAPENQRSKSGDIVFQQMRATGDLGQWAARPDGVVSRSASKPEARNLQIKAIEALYGQTDKLTGSFAEAGLELQKLKSAIGDAENPLYQLALAAQQYNQQQQQYAMPYMSRASQVMSAADQYAAAQQYTGPDSRDLKLTAEADYESAKASYYGYLQSLILAHKQYALSMDRADADYQKTVSRATSNFQLSMQYAEQDYYKSRMRAQEGFNIQMQRMAEDAAKNIYDPYTRITTQATWDAENLLQNLADQNESLAKQTRTLRQLRQAGVSQEVIDTLGLADPANAQQAARLLGDIMADPKLVEVYNETVKDRFDWTKGLVTSDNNQAFRRMQEDFERAAKHAEEDFDTSMKRASDAFDLSMEQMAEDYQTQTARAAEDIALLGQQVFGNFQNVAERAINLIRNNIGDLGDKAVNEINRVGRRLVGVANDIATAGSGGGGGGGGGVNSPASTGHPSQGYSGSSGSTTYKGVGVNFSNAGSSSTAPSMTPKTRYDAEKLERRGIDDNLDRRNKFLKVLYNQLGEPYNAVGDNGPDAFDCSGLVQFAANKVGISLVHKADTQIRNSRSISPSQALPGDLVAFEWGDNDGEYDHIGVYVGGGNMIHANRPGGTVHVASVGAQGGKEVRWGRIPGLARGGVARGLAVVGDGDSDETVIPLNARGHDFMMGMYQSISRELVKGMVTQSFASPVSVSSGFGGGHVDSSVNFHGPVSVAAQDPNEMGRKLEAKARMKRLTNSGVKR